MEKIPAKVGWAWVKQGFALYRKQPAELSTLFLGYMFLMLVTVLIPVIGQLLPVILVPVFSMAFMQACANVEQDKRVYPNLLLTGFRSPALRTLLKLGLLYLAAAALAIAASILVDGGMLWQVMTGDIAISSKEAQQSRLPVSIQFSAFVYTLATLPFWFAAPLIAWQNMSLGKAIFYSFYTVRRAFKAFLFYGLAWIAIGNLLNNIIIPIIGMILGKTLTVLLFLLPLSIVVTVIMYCSFYATYAYMFDQPQLPSPPEIEPEMP